MLQNGDILDGVYQIIREIGRGGTGIIYLAEHLRLRKYVVVKKIKDNFVGQVKGRIEVDILKRLHHSYLPQVYDFLVLNGSVYTVMEYVEGHDLQYFIDQGQWFDETILHKWLLQLCEVLMYLHGQHPMILHSDIKPSNIMVTPQGNVCLIDFNISLDGENSKDIQGISANYAAPEQYEKVQSVLYGRESKIKLDGRMDIYSLGATFYALMTRYLPPAPGEPLYDIAYMEVPYSEGLKAVVSKAMKQNPSARFHTAEHMRRALQDVSRMDPIYKRYSRIQIGAVFIWLFCMIVGSLMIYYGSWQKEIEDYQSAYRVLYVAAQSQDETQIVVNATSILNSFKYRNYLKKHADSEAEILHILGDSYFRQEKYEDAAMYYDKAFRLLPREGGYCKDYVVALVRAGEEEEAGRVMASAEGLENLSEFEQQLIQAEIDWLNGSRDAALAKLKSMLSGTPDSGNNDTFVNGYLLEAEIYGTEAQYGEAVKALEAASKLSDSRDILRQMGQMAAQAASVSKKQENQTVYLTKALQCYESLNQMAEPTYEDKMNLALTRRGLKDYQGSIDVLKAMSVSYPGDYVIGMWMCYNYLGIAEEKEDYSAVADELKFRFEDCKTSYMSSGKTDSDMETLIQLMREVEALER